MNARIDSVATLDGTRAHRHPEDVEMHPASGIVTAVGLSLLLWAAGFALLFVAL